MEAKVPQWSPKVTQSEKKDTTRPPKVQLRHQNVPQDAKKQAHIDTNNQPTNQQNKQREKQINKQPHKHTTQANKPSNKQARKHHTKHTKHKPTISLKSRLGLIASNFKEKTSRGRVLAEGDVDPAAGSRHEPFKAVGRSPRSKLISQTVCVKLIYGGAASGAELTFGRPRGSPKSLKKRC